MKNEDFIKEITGFEAEINRLYQERLALEKEKNLATDTCEAERVKVLKQIEYEANRKNEDCRKQYYLYLENLDQLKNELKDCEETLGKVKGSTLDTLMAYDKRQLDELLKKIGDSSLSAAIQKIFHLNGYFSNRKMKFASYQMIQDGIAQADEKLKKAAENCNNRLAVIQQEKITRYEQNKIIYYGKTRKIHSLYMTKIDNLERKRQALWTGDRPVHLFEAIQQTGRKVGLTMKTWDTYKPVNQRAGEVSPGWLLYPLNIPGEDRIEMEKRFPHFYSEKIIRFPYVFTYSNSLTLYLEFTQDGRILALDGIRYLILQLIRTMPLLQYKISFLDPLERGTSIERLQKLTEGSGCDICYDAVCSVEDGLKHIMKLQEKYDRQYAPKLAGKGNIDDYNKEGRDLLEYQILVINDVEEFRENPFYKTLGTLIENAEKFGTSVIILNNRSREEELQRNRGENKEWNIFLNMYHKRFHSIIWKQNSFWDAETGLKVLLSKASQIPDVYIKSIADCYRQGLDIDNDFLKYICCDERRIKLRDPYNKNYIRIPFAIDQNRQIHELELGSELNAHAMVIGGTGAGKTNTLHVLITSLAVHYHPDDVEIWLLDFKFTEMKIYKGACWIPHIRLIGMDTEDSFAAGILGKLESELTRRKKLITGDIHDYEAERRESLRKGEQPKEKLSHVVLILDEYQRLIQAVNGTDERVIVENLLRESRALGMYFVFSSQTSTGLLKDNEMGQISGRMFMRVEGERQNDEKLAFFGMTKGEEKEKLDVLSRNLGTGAMVYRNVEKVGKDVSENHYVRVRSLYLPKISQKMILTKIADMKIFKGHLPKRTLCYEGRRRKEMIISQIVEDEKSLGYRKGIAPENPDDRILYLGTPVGPDFYTRMSLMRSRSDHIMLMGRNRKLQYAVLMSLIKSYVRKTGTDTDGKEIWIVADEYNPLYTDYQKEWMQLPERNGRIQVLEKISEICKKIYELREMVLRKERKDILLVIIGLSELLETMSGYPKTYERKQSPPLQAPVENAKLLSDGNGNSDLEERRKKILEAIGGHYGKESEQKAQNLQKHTETETKSVGFAPVVEMPLEDGCYNAISDMRDVILGRGALFDIHVIITADTYSEVKGGEMRGCLERCRHRIGCGLTKEECGSFLENMKVGNMLDDNTCAYYDGSRINYFLPFMM